MQIGIVLPTFTRGVSAEGVEAAAETAERLGWASAWTTDHILVGRADRAIYGHIYEAITTAAYVAGRTSGLTVGISVVVVPQRNAVVLAKELATIDALSRGRLIAGVGVGWSEHEFANLGAAERFHRRGGYLDEAIRLWRHLWSGSAEPFEGRFHRFDDFVFEPLPARLGGPPIWVGGRAEPALARAGRLGDAYHASQTDPDTYAGRTPIVRAAAEAAGRPMPALTARVTVRFDAPAARSGYLVTGDDEAVAAELRRWAALGVEHLAVGFGETEPARVVAAMERFDREVLPRLD